MRYYLKSRNGIWQICWTNPNGTPGRKSTGTRDRARAELSLASHQLANERPRDQLLQQVTLDQLLLRYWEQHGKTRFSAAAIRRTIGLAAQRKPCITLAEFTLAEQEDMVAGLKPTTARRYMGVIRAAIRRAVRRGEVEREIPVYQPEGDDGPGARPFGIEELGALLEAARGEHERRFLLLFVATGARPQAILQLTWDRVQDGVADFHTPGRRRTKKRRAKAPLPPTVAAWLEQRRGLGPVVQWRDRQMRGHRMTFQRVAARAGVTGTAYGIRKAVATWLRAQDVPEWEVGALLAHRVASATTERYAHYRPGYMRATVAAVERLLGQIRPSWLAIALPARKSHAEASAAIRRQVNGLDGSREWDRTTDHFHVKEVGLAETQQLKPINDD